MTAASEIADRLAAVRERVAAAAVRAGRAPEEIVLVGIAKKKSAALVAAAVRAGLRDVGESYVQEAVAKIPQVRAELARTGSPGPRWHFVGQLQRNKARDVARFFDLVASVDREPLGAELDRRAEAEGRDLELLLQVNVSGEAQKAGVDPAGLLGLMAASTGWGRLRVAGLMAIPAAGDDPEASRPAFSRLRELRDGLRAESGGKGLTELSMGMSGDFEVAIEEGATIVRVGTAIFGPRSAT